jgi:hypothetical protein
MTLTSNTPARFRRLVPATVAAPAVALAVMILTAPAAQALTEQEIQALCKNMMGTYSTQTSESGETTSKCCYKSVKGKQVCDIYSNGRYMWTVAANQVPTGPTEQPVQPPPGTAPAAPGTPTATVHPVQPPPATGAPVIP